ATPIRDSGYGEYPEKKFKEAYQLEGDVRTLILDPQIRKKWNEWRADNITAAVKKFSEAIRAVKKDILISADVVANVNLARNTYMQDWPTWVSAGYIDLLCPMIYTGSTTVVTADAQTIKNRLDNLSFLATGIAPLYYGYPIEVNLEQINAANDFGGASIFASQNIIGNKDIEASLCDGIYRLPSISPLTDPALVFAAAMSDLCAYYSYYRDACGDNYDILKEKMNEIIAMKCENPADYQKIMEKLNHLSLLTAYLDNDEVQNNLKIKIHRLTDTLDIKISREMIALGYYDPKSGSRPDPELFDYPSGDSSPNPEPKKGCFRSNGIIISGLIGLLYLKRKDLFSL
ncbi:MAG: family 10 glycosylhydrolase, partial [Bacilli bacterium]|nr:family 10 glycosylhydrolase [Bacilli bacterium]